MGTGQPGAHLLGLLPSLSGEPDEWGGGARTLACPYTPAPTTENPSSHHGQEGPGKPSLQTIRRHALRGLSLSFFPSTGREAGATRGARATSGCALAGSGACGPGPPCPSLTTPSVTYQGPCSCPRACEGPGGTWDALGRREGGVGFGVSRVGARMDLSFWGQQASDSAPKGGLLSGHLELTPSASRLLHRQQTAVPALALSGPAEAGTHRERRAEASAVQVSRGRS